MSPQATSPEFPDRLIHPLPKRRLRERISPDVAKILEYPPHVAHGMLFNYPFNAKSTQTAQSTPGTEAQPADRTHTPGRASRAASPIPEHDESPSAAAAAQSVTAAASSRPTTAVGNSRDEPESPSAAGSTRVVHGPTRQASSPRTPRTPQPARRLFPSTPLSVDGYECLESTKNKKKRKIPAISDALVTGTHDTADLQAPTPTSAADSAAQTADGSPLHTARHACNFALHHSTCSFASRHNACHFASPGVSGPGRGRCGRSRGGRGHLHALSNANIGWNRENESRPARKSAVTTAIASAGGRARTSPKSKAADDGFTRVPPPFSFRCASSVPGHWPVEQEPGARHRVHCHLRNRQTVRTVRSCGACHSGPSAQTTPHAHKPPERKATVLRREINAQIRDRRRAQKAKNASAPDEDPWTCLFCEYEMIFGTKPKLLMLRFEKKALAQAKKADESAKARSKNKARHDGHNRRRSTAASVARPTGDAPHPAGIGIDEGPPPVAGGPGHAPPTVASH